MKKIECGECDAASQLQNVNLKIEWLCNFIKRMIVISSLGIFVNTDPDNSGHKSQS